MIEAIVTLSNGEVSEIDPVVNITIDNSYHKYDFKPEEIVSIEIREVGDGRRNDENT